MFCNVKFTLLLLLVTFSNFQTLQLELERKFGFLCSGHNEIDIITIIYKIFFKPGWMTLNPLLAGSKAGVAGSHAHLAGSQAQLADSQV